MLRKFNYEHVYSCLDHLHKIDSADKSCYIEVDLQTETVYICQEYQVLYKEKITQTDLLNIHGMLSSVMYKAEDEDIVISRDEEITVIIYCTFK